VKPPIFVVAADGLLAFESPTRAEGWVESIDVEDGEYLDVFDSEGRLLAFEVERPTVRHKSLGLESVELTPVRLVEKESQPTHAENLKSALLGALARVGQPGEHAHATMEDLVEEALRRFRV
jgi:hypothetical protein